MDINILGSSSAGNATIIDGSLLIDFGLNKSILADYLKDISYMICTHRHGDHYNKSIITWVKKNRPELLLYGSIFNEDCANMAGIQSTPKREFKTLKTLDGEYEIYLFPVIHDVDCQGVSIFKKSTKELLIYATDLSKLPDNNDIQTILQRYDRQDFDYILLEGNYDLDILTQAMLNIDTSDRAVRNLRHLSNKSWKMFIDAYSHDGTKYYQMHMSEMFGKKLT